MTFDFRTAAQTATLSLGRRKYLAILRGAFFWPGLLTASHFPVTGRSRDLKGDREVRGIIWVCLLSHHKDKCFAPSPGNFISSAEKVISAYLRAIHPASAKKTSRKARADADTNLPEIFEHAPPPKN